MNDYSDGEYVKLFRKITKWEWWPDPPTRDVFIYCLIRANWKDGRFKGHEVKRGQFVTSLPTMARETGFSVQQVRTAIKHLKSTGELTQSSTSKWSVITVLNYDRYQETNRQTNRQLTGNQQATNNNRRSKEVKKERSIGVSKDTLSSNDDDVAAVIDHLNERTGSHYRHGTQGTEKYIRARLAEGYTVEDLNAVTDTKADQWQADEKMAKYLRPSTLFNADKFPGYLEECQEHDDGYDWSDITDYFPGGLRAIK